VSAAVPPAAITGGTVTATPRRLHPAG